MLRCMCIGKSILSLNRRRILATVSAPVLVAICMFLGVIMFCRLLVSRREAHLEHLLPCKNDITKRFRASPTHPIMRTTFGFSIASEELATSYGEGFPCDAFTGWNREPLNRLDENAHPEGKQEHPIEEGT